MEQDNSQPKEFDPTPFDPVDPPNLLPHTDPAKSYQASPLKKRWGAWKGHRYKVHSALAFFALNETILSFLPKRKPQLPNRSSGMLRRASISLQIVRLQLLCILLPGLFWFFACLPWTRNKQNTMLLRTRALLAYLQLLLEEKRLRDRESWRTYSPAMLHGIKARQISFLNNHIYAMTHLGLLDPLQSTTTEQSTGISGVKSVEISHLILTLAAAMRPNKEYQRHDCDLSDRSEHLLDTLACLKNMVIAREGKRTLLRPVPIRWIYDSAWVDLLESVLKAYLLFRHSKGISEPSMKSSTFPSSPLKNRTQQRGIKLDSEVAIAKHILGKQESGTKQ